MCTDPIGMYAFTVSEAVRLDTGSEHVMLPLSSFVKATNKSEGRFGVTRITGPCGEKHRNGFVPCDGIKLVPKVVPAHIIISEKVSGQIV